MDTIPQRERMKLVGETLRTLFPFFALITSQYKAKHTWLRSIMVSALGCRPKDEGSIPSGVA